MIEPALADDAFLEDVASARSPGDGFRLWWLGQSGFLIQWGDRHLVLDPYLSDSLTKKYAGTERPHVRMTRRVIAPERLDFLDVVTSSHNHTDHLDQETLGPILHANPGVRLIVPAASRAFAAERLGIDPARLDVLDDGLSADFAGFRMSGIASAHESLERDAEGRSRFLGYVVSFGPWTVYHPGDTVLYEGLEEELRPWSIDVALLPINGAAPERGVAGNLDGPEAARLARSIGARLVIPCHYDMFEFNTASPDPFAAEARRIGQPSRILLAGERWTSAEIGQRAA
ncbi:MAG TPA: MBL fold metallo-hydrolase [Candidatus Limnocylindrales bacterium]|nr:MBL fold metallo-hydrolase [Candidatus Limnocylindrales bacterium]